MKKKIAILGSTGSIGKSTVEIIKKDKNNFEVVLLTSHKNIKELDKQRRIFKVKNLIVTDRKSFIFLKKKYKNNNIRIFNDYKNLDNIFKKKLGRNSDFFSYPFGEYSVNFKNIIKSLGFKYAFGQHSGVIDDTKKFF